MESYVRAFIIWIICMFVSIILCGIGECKSVQLNWNKVKGATGYKVYYKQDGDASYPPGEDVGNIDTSVVKDVKDGLWNFAITAYNDYGESVVVNPITLSLNTITAPNVKWAGELVDINWSSINNIEKYIIKIKNSDGSLTEVERLPGITSYKATLSIGTYEISIFAKQVGADIFYQSAAATVSVLPSPTGVTATIID